MLHHVLEEHRRYLADASRMNGYRRALEESLAPGSAVLDLGTGTGLLGLLACRAGARRVYSVDRGGIIELAREIAELNGFGGRMVFIQGMSTQIDLPEKVDLVVADQVGFLGHEAGLIAFFQDAKRRFLKPQGRLMPSSLDLYLAPVDSQASWDQVGFWSTRHGGFDLKPVRSRAENTCFLVRLGRQELLGDGSRAGSIALGGPDGERVRVEAEIEIRRPGMLHGIGGWCRALLSPGVVISNSPEDSDAIDRPQAFFPIGRPIEVSERDRVRIRMQIQPIDLVTWSVEVARSGGPRGAAGESSTIRFEHSTFKGMLVSREEVQARRPDHAPSLSPLGQAQLDVLNLCDGHTSLVQIEAEIRRRHPGLFSDSAEAAAFVSKVVGRSCRLPGTKAGERGR